MILEATFDNKSLNNISTNSDIDQTEVLYTSKSLILYCCNLISSSILVIVSLSFIFTFTKLSRLIKNICKNFIPKFIQKIKAKH